MTVASERVTEKVGENVRDETLKLAQLDLDYLERLIQDQINKFEDDHRAYFEQRREWMLALRDLQYKYKESFFEDASDIHIPYTLIMAKALHARIYQVFSQENFFTVEANNKAFLEKEELVTQYMNWLLSKCVNRGKGKDQAMDDYILDYVEEGCSVMKLLMDRWQIDYVDVSITTEEEILPEIFVSETDVGTEASVEDRTRTKTKIENVQKSLKNSAPALGTVNLDDFIIQAGCKDVQTAPFVGHRVKLLDEDLKLRAQQKRFDMGVVEEALERRLSFTKSRDDGSRPKTRRDMRTLEGVSSDSDRTVFRDQASHSVVEWYCRAYVKKKVDDDTFEDTDELPREIVVWYHEDLRKILGWTYLHRISPSGQRPFYKSDFIPSKERAFGIGVAELLWSINNHIDGVHNLKMDNGVLASLQFGIYRAGSTFKPDTFKIRPGDMLPVEDINDFKFTQIPYLGQFGENEELTLTGYGEKMLAINDINLGNLTGRGVAGALRNATGASFVDRQANIQLHPHLSRLARTLKLMLRDLFILARSRMSEQLFFRVTGEDGKAIFGDVTQEQLHGDYDFSIEVNLAASSEAERQQRATLMLQNVLNPTLLQMGIVQPGNIYAAMKEYMIRHQVKNPDAYLTKPQDYVGAPLTPSDRIFKILVGQYDDPPIELTVKPEENHELALEVYERFKDNPAFGLLDKKQLAAIAVLTQKHQMFMELVSGGMKGTPNLSGTQMPATGGIAGSPAGGGPLGGVPEGEVNGPVF